MHASKRKRCGSFGSKGCFTTHRLVENGSERIEVGSPIDRTTFNLFGSEVFHGSENLSGACEVGFIENLGDAEIGYQNPAVIGKENVRGLDVAMNDASFVSDCECSGNFRTDVNYLDWIKCTALVEKVAQRSTANKFHDNRVASVEVDCVINCNN
jgi:hypothetical protein